MYHTQGSLSANKPSKSKYAQLYIYDPEFVASVRSSNNSKVDDKKKLDDTIISNLSSILHGSNHFVMLCKTSHELLTANHDEVKQFQNSFCSNFSFIEN
jgi:hypothetical protein